MALRLNDPLRSAIIDGIVGNIGTGGLKVYGGDRPSEGGGTAGTQEILVELSGIVWGTALNGTAAITGSINGTSGTGGTAIWARLSGTDGTGYVIDGICGTAATSDFVIDQAVIQTSDVVTLTAASLIQPAG